MSEELNRFNKDELYAVFTQGQRKHDCPGFDCSVCSQCFDNVICELEKIRQPSSTSAVDWELFSKTYKKWLNHTLIEKNSKSLPQFMKDNCKDWLKGVNDGS